MDSLIFVSIMIDLILKYGLPGALAIIDEWKEENPTLDDFEKLRDKVKRPEEYFE